MCGPPNSSGKRKNDSRNDRDDVAVKKKKVDTEEVDDTNIPSKLYVCQLCPDSSYYTEKDKLMSQHVNRHHKEEKYEKTNKKLFPRDCVVEDPVEIQSILDKSKKTKFQYICDICGEGFNLAKSLHQHKANRHAEKFVYCCTVPFCGRLEYTSGNMSKHMERNHNGILYDRELSKELMTQKYAEAEEKNVKISQRMYSCPNCTKEFKYRNHLKNHMKSYKLEERTCQVKTCMKVCNNPSQLRIHEARVHDPNKLPFACTMIENCHKRYANQEELDDHQKYSIAHNPIPRFQCGNCSRRFHWPKTLKEHQQKSCISANEIGPRQFRYKCEICSKGYYYEKYFKAHQQRHADGTLNLQVPSNKTKKVYREMMFDCTMAIGMERCNPNKVAPKGKSHLIVVPCENENCQQRAIMFSSAETPWLHLSKLLSGMIRGHACTSLHAHCDVEKGKGHVFDVYNARFVADAAEPYEAQIVKKMVVKLAKLVEEGEHPRVTNHTEYEIYHEYDKTAIDEIIQIMIREKLTSKDEPTLRADINNRLAEFQNEDGTTVRQHNPLVFKDGLFQRVKTDNDDESVASIDLQLRDEITEEDEVDCEDEEQDEEQDEDEDEEQDEDEDEEQDEEQDEDEDEEQDEVE